MHRLVITTKPCIKKRRFKSHVNPWVRQVVASKSIQPTSHVWGSDEFDWLRFRLQDLSHSQSSQLRAGSSVFAVGRNVQRINEFTEGWEQKLAGWFVRLIVENHDLQVKNRRK